MTLAIGALITDAEVCGPASTADWSRWIDHGRAPAATGQWPDRADDHLAMLRTLGVEDVVITLEWARLQPGPFEHAHLEIERYEALLARLRDFGFSPWGCLVDGTLPGWFADDEGGFDDDRSRGLLWPRHVDWVGETFGHQLDGWVTQREPARRVVRSQLLGLAPPGRSDRRATANAVVNALLAEGEAWRLLRGSAPVAAVMTGQHVVAARDDVKAPPHARWIDELQWGCWERAFTDGVVQVGDGGRHEAPHLRDAFDVLVTQLRPPVELDGTGAWGRPRMPLADAHHHAADRAASLAGGRSLIVAGDLGQVPDDGRARRDMADTMLDISTDVGAERFWLTSPVSGWHWEHGETRSPGAIGRDGAIHDAARALSDAASSRDASSRDAADAAGAADQAPDEGLR